MPTETANELLHDALIRHQIFLLRYSGSVRNKMIDLLDASEEAIYEKIVARLAGNEGLTTPAAVARLETTLQLIRRIRDAAWEEANTYFIDQNFELVYQEPIMFGNMVGTAVPFVYQSILPARQQLKSIATSEPFQGRTLKEWAKSMQEDDLRRILDAVRVGMVAGEDSATIARRVIGTKALKGSDGVTEASRRQVQAISRTAVNFISNRARDAYLDENSELFELESFVATLDSRTTPVCRANDGKTFPRKKGPRPPLHIACRSLRVAVINGNAIGERPAKPIAEDQIRREFAEANDLGRLDSRSEIPHGYKGKYDDYRRKRLREMTGRVPAETTFQQWLERQSLEFQEDILGKTKAKLFRDGKLPLDRFVNRNGDELTLAQLAKSDSWAFRAAGLDPANYH